MIQLLKDKAKAGVYSAAVVLVMMQWVLPGFFDFIFDVVLLGLLVTMDKMKS